jgi:histidine ammonia-lyase
VARTAEAVERLADLLAVELLTARMVVRETADARLGAGTERALTQVDAVLAGLRADRSSSEIHEAAAHLVRQGFDGIDPTG